MPAHPLSFSVLKTMPTFLPTALAALSLAATTFVAYAQAAEPASRAAAVANSPRLRALDFTPFAAALDALPAERTAALDELLRKATISDLQAALRAGQLSATELTLYFLQRTRRFDERLRTLVELNPHALDEARAADARRKSGKPLGAMDGIPVTLKDNIETAGPMHTTAGAELLLDHVASRDAPLVAQLRAAGAVILGKANLSEWAGVVALTPPHMGGSSAVGGQTLNPHGAALTGGSSAGSAAGTAARLTMVSVGTETSGSLITPSSWNGVVGMKPSRDRVSGAGVIPLIKANDSAGPIGRSVTDVAVLLGAIAQDRGDYTRHLQHDALDGVAVGVLADEIVQTEGNTALLQAASGTLVAAGASLRPVTLGPRPPALADGNFLAFMAAGLRHDTLGYVAALGGPVKSVQDLVAYDAAQPQRRQPFGANLLAGLAPMSAQIGAADYAAMAQALRRAASTQLDAAFASKKVQVLVSFENLHSMQYATAGYPAITVPLGLRTRGGMAAQIGAKAEGMPVGITFIGRPGDDARLLGYAYAFEQATRLRVDPVLP
jgi:amidase